MFKYFFILSFLISSNGFPKESQVSFINEDPSNFEIVDDIVSDQVNKGRSISSIRKPAKRSRKMTRSRALSIYQQNIRYAFENGFRYSLVPWIKEFLYLSKGNTGSIERFAQEVILDVGAKNFEGLRLAILQNAKGSSFNYLAAKKLFSRGKYEMAAREFDKISANSVFYSFALNYLGVVNYLQKRYSEALEFYETCITVSNKWMDKVETDSSFKQIKVNRDICIAGKARVFYAQGDLDKADFLYLDLEKKSIVWPSILMEEAWSSYYAKSYNRTLGKLVTYNAPLLRYNVNPEIFVLRAMTYLKMCLYADVNLVVEDFYKRYESLAKNLEQLVSRRRNNKAYFYNMMISYDKYNNPEMMYALKSIYKSPNVKSFIENIKNAEDERSNILRIRSGTVKKSLLNNVNEFVASQKKVLGIITKAKLQKYSYDLRKAFQAMSYMKLEVLGRKKESLYFGKSYKGKRGDVKYLKRNDKQYFWDFKGEFWSDELGDYVFTLPRECPNGL